MVPEAEARLLRELGEEAVGLWTGHCVASNVDFRDDWIEQYLKIRQSHPIVQASPPNSTDAL